MLSFPSQGTEKKMWFCLFYFNSHLLRGGKKRSFVYLMSRFNELHRGGVGTSGVSINCHHTDNVFSMRLTKDSHFCTVAIYSSLPVYIYSFFRGRNNK